MFVAIYALGAAWLVISATTQPEPLRLSITTDGSALVLSGAVTDDDARAAVIHAVSDVTGAAVLVAEVDVDPDAEPVPDPRRTASDLFADLPPDRN